MTFAPIVLAVVIGLLVGVARRGRLISIARTRLRHPEFLVVAVASSVVVDATDIGSPGAIALVGLIAGLAFASVNAHLTGMAVIAIGLTANLIPVALNGAMPVRPEALVEAEMVTLEELGRVSLTGARELADDTTTLEVLGDTIPVRFTGQVVSIGDLIMMVGLADLVTHLMLQRRRRRVPPSALASLAALGWHEGPEEEGAIVDLSAPRPISPTVDLTESASRPLPSLQPAAARTTASPVQD